MNSDGFLDSPQLKRKILRHIENGTYRLTKHAAEEQADDDLDLQDTLHVLRTGIHESSKTLRTHYGWKYAIRGTTADLKDVRVVIAFSEEMIIITVIGLWKKKKKRSSTKG